MWRPAEVSLSFFATGRHHRGSGAAEEIREPARPPDYLLQRRERGDPPGQSRRRGPFFRARAIEAGARRAQPECRLARLFRRHGVLLDCGQPLFRKPGRRVPRCRAESGGRGSLLRRQRGGRGPHRRERAAVRDHRCSPCRPIGHPRAADGTHGLFSDGAGLPAGDDPDPRCPGGGRPHAGRGAAGAGIGGRPRPGFAFGQNAGDAVEKDGAGAAAHCYGDSRRLRRDRSPARCSRLIRHPERCRAGAPPEQWRDSPGRWSWRGCCPT